MNRLKKTLLGAGLLATLGALAPLTASAQQPLVTSSFVGAGHTINNHVFAPLDRLLRASGAPGLDVRHGGIGGPLDQYRVVFQGDAELAWAVSAYTPLQLQKTMLAELPIIPEGAFGHQLLWNAWDAGQLANEFPGTVPLALWVSEPSVIISRTPIRTPADLQGKRVRISTHPSMIEVFGASAIPLTAGELFTALSTGQVDAIITGSSAIRDFGLEDAANYYTLGAPWGQVSFVLIINEARYNALPAATRNLLSSVAGRELSCRAELGWYTTAHQVVNDLRANPAKTVIDLTPEEIDAFARILDPIVQQEINRIPGGRAAVDAMLAQTSTAAPTWCEQVLGTLGVP